MIRRWAHDPLHSDPMGASTPAAPTLTESERREIARFEAVDGTPLIRITDKPAIPFGYQSAREDQR